MSGSELFAARRMRVSKVERNETGGDILVQLVPDTAFGRPVSAGIVVYDVRVVFRGIDPPLLDEPFDVHLREGEARG